MSGTQAGMLMFVFVTSTILLYVPGFTANDAKESAWLAASILPFSYGFMTLWVLYKLGNYFPKLTIFQYCEVILGKFLGKCFQIPYILFLMVMDALVLREFSDFLIITTLPLTPKICLLMCILVLATYGAYKGLEVIARAVQFIIGIYLTGFLVVLMLALTNFEWGRLLPIMENGVWPIVRGSLAPASWYGEICLLAILFPFVNKSKEVMKKGLISLLAITVFLTIDVLVTIGVLGSSLTSVVTLPFWVVTRSIEIGEVLQRLESFFLVIWITGIIIKASLLSYLIGLGISQVFGFPKTNLVLGFIVISELFISLFMGNASQVNVILKSFWPPFAIVFELVIPIILLIIRRLKKSI